MIYFVATPIGNLKDISYRAVETLKNADIIYCEDTRHSLKLLTAYEIKKPLYSYHKFNENEASEKIIENALQGKVIAIISDAGMPCISDPGYILCQKLNERGIKYTIIPGACACVSALVLSAINSDKFAFFGFLKGNAKDKSKLLEKYKNSDLTLIFYSAPQDVEKDILTLYNNLGERNAVAVREITKIYEEARHFKLSENLDGEKKGEYVIIVEGAKDVENSLCQLTESEHIDYYINLGYNKKEALKRTARDRNVTKSELYKFSIDK